MSQSNKFIGFYQYNHKYDTSNLSQFIPWEHRGGLMTPSRTGKIEWQKVYGSKLVTSFQYGLLDLRQPLLELLASGVRAAHSTRSRGMIQGPQTTIGQRPHNPRHHYKGNDDLVPAGSVRTAATSSRSASTTSTTGSAANIR